ncbi:ATP-binding protein [Bosea sp. 2YAB26]|uniref:sensor histidine kinase n=1 Tax=Bosea sp. 2YAB26 TaxID=3237478 RepID=UPI003F92D3C0
MTPAPTILPATDDGAATRSGMASVAALPPRDGRPRLWLAVLAAMLVLGIAYLTQAEPPPRPAPLPSLNGTISVLSDPASSLSLAEILDSAKQAEFRTIQGAHVNFGFTRTPVWIRMELPGRVTKQAILSLAPNFLDYVDIYTAAPDAPLSIERFTRHEMGDRRPLPRDGLSALDYAIRLDLAEGATTRVFIRVRNGNSATYLNLRLTSAEDYAAGAALDASLYGAWLGGMGVLLVTQLVFFYFDRKAQYPLLAASTLGIMLIYMGNLGYSRVYLFPENGAANDAFLGFNAWAGLTASAIAYMRILDLRNRAPLLHRLYQGSAAAGLVGVGFAFAGLNMIFGPIGTVLGIVMACVNMVQGLRQWSDEGAASRLRGAAFSALCVGAFLTMAQRLGVAWLPHWAIHSYGIAGLFLTVLLTGALAVRLRDAEALTLRMKDEALRHAQLAENIAAGLVEERTRELVDARRIAEDALHLEKQSQLQQVRFLEVVSHQYRTPLAAIRSSIDSIGLALQPDDGANQGRIERIRRAIARLVEMLEINLARSRVQGPSFRPRIAHVNAGALVVAAHQRACDLLSGPTIKLLIEPRAAQATIVADEGMMELVIINLLENAVKFTALKGSEPIALALGLAGEEITITVTDRGCGIPASELPGAFVLGVRGRYSQAVEGSGLGLFLVKKIVTAHDGRVSIESSEGEGTTVRVALPTAP